MKIAVSSLVLLVLFVACGGNGGGAGASIDAPSGIPDGAPDGDPELPAPALDTAEMRLNGAPATLVKKEFCRDGGAGIGFVKSDVPGQSTPTLFLHNVDLTDSGEILIKTGGAWHLDIDDQMAGAVWGTTDQGCTATILESSATSFELKALNCAIRAQFGEPQAGTTSFHVRCARDDN